MTDFAELIGRLHEADQHVFASRARVRSGAGGQTVEATARATLHEISAWDAELLSMAATALAEAQAEIARLTAARYAARRDADAWADEYVKDKSALEAEIAWHEGEAKRHREAAAKSHQDDPEGWLHNTEAALHETSTSRLRAILHAGPPSEEEIAF